MPTEGTTEYAIGTDQTSHRRWLVQERDKTIALWIKAVEAKEDEKVLVKYRAMAIALGELIESLDAVKSVATPKYYVNRPSSRSKSEPGRLSGGKRIPGPAFRITLSKWSASSRLDRDTYDVPAIIAAAFMMLAVAIVMR